MIKRLMILPLALVFIIVACPSLAQAQSLNDSTNETNIRELNESGTGSVPNLSYIWSVMGIETGPVIMVLEQEGENLYGQAKYEPDSGQSWNGVVIGSVKGNSIDLVLTSLRGTEQTANLLKGNIDPESQSIMGDLTKVSNGQISQRGEFEAVWINPDVSSYTPAIVTEPKAPSTASAQRDPERHPAGRDSELAADIFDEILFP